MKKLYFICGCQELYGEETVKQAKDNAMDIAKTLSHHIHDVCEVDYRMIVTTSQEAIQVMQEANTDADCVGVITWMHTFSPAKMWIRALQILQKPLLHLHTQHNQELPYRTIDMDFMNLNQSAHGDREFSFVLARLKIPHAIAIGYYKSKKVIQKIRQFAEVAIAIDYSRNLKCAMFGNNMRQVAVTDGDRVESQIHFGWEVNYYPIGDLVGYTEQVSEQEIEEKMQEYNQKYVMHTDRRESVAEQAKYDVALHKFLNDQKIQAFTDTFQDLYGLKQLPGLAIQNLFAEGVGFAPEGDYKTSCLCALLMKLTEKRKGATGFIEDYTYDLTEGKEVELASHMLEVPAQFAVETPRIEVHPLSIGGKEDPARLVFSSIEGEAIQVTMIDLGTHFKMIAIPVRLVKAKEMPELPVARIMFEIRPSFEEGLQFWLEQGGGHHAVLSNCLTMEDLQLFSKLTNTEFVYLENK